MLHQFQRVKTVVVLQQCVKGRSWQEVAKSKICDPVYYLIRKFIGALSSDLICSCVSSSSIVHHVRDTDCLTGASQYSERVG